MTVDHLLLITTVGALLLVSFFLALLFKGQRHMDKTLDDIKADVIALGGLVARLLAVVGSVPAGTFTAEQQAEINDIDATAKAALATDPNPPATT